MRHVSCTRASQLSIILSLSLPSMCEIFLCFTGYLRGRIVEATFHLPMQAGILRKLETLTTDGRHVDIGGLTRR